MPADIDSTDWRLKTLESNLSRVEQKLDVHMDKVESRLAAQAKFVSEKLDDITRELQLSRAAMPDQFIQRRELTDFMTDMRNRWESLTMRLERDVVPKVSYEERHAHLINVTTDNRVAIEQLQRDLGKAVDDIRREKHEDSSRTNIALIGSGLSFIGGVVLHFLPPIHIGV